jgi:hypothetical protein
MSQAGLLDTRSRGRYVGNNGSEPLLGRGGGRKGSQTGWTIAIILIAAVTVTGLVLGAIAVSYGKNDVNDPLEIGTIKVTEMADVKDLVVSGSLELTNKEKKTIHVGATREYKTVSEALCQFNGRHVGDVDILVDPGVYTDSIDLGGNSTNSVKIENVGGGNAAGLQIIGDNRISSGLSYTVGAPNIAPSSPQWTVTTSVSGVGPFQVAEAFFDSDLVVTAPLKLATDFLCNTDPFVPGFFNGSIAVVNRGTCAFVEKVFNAIDAGAVGIVIYNNDAMNPDVTFTLGPDIFGAFTETTVLMSYNDGLALVAAIQSNPGIEGTLSFTASPPVGESEKKPVFTHPTGLNSLRVTIGNDNPDFAQIGVVAGDKVMVSVFDSAQLFSVRYMEREIQSVVGNTLTFLTPLDMDSTGTYTTLTFLPNVRFRPTDASTNTLFANQASASFLGIFFQYDTAQPAVRQDGSVGGYKSTLFLSGCVFQTNPAFDPALVYAFRYGTLSFASSPAFSNKRYSSTVLHARLVITEGSQISGRVLTLVGTEFIAQLTSKLFTSNVNILNSNGLNIPGVPAILLTDSSSSAASSTFIGGHGDNSPHIDVQFFSKFDSNVLEIEGPRGPNAPGITLGSGSKVNIVGEFKMTSAATTYGIIAVDKSDLIFSREPEYVNVTNPYLILDSSTYNIKRTLFGLAYPAVFTHTTSGQVDQYYPIQHISNGGTPITLDLIIFRLFADQLLYVGKTYKLVNVDGAAHELTLDGDGFPAYFIGGGANSTIQEDVYTFPEEEGSCLTITVLTDEIVQVCDSAGGTFSLAAKKKRSVALRTERTHVMSKAEKMYMDNMKHAKAMKMSSEDKLIGPNSLSA